jgi:23S rRNA-/tRNA-specific pseudouridylate synthase
VRAPIVSAPIVYRDQHLLVLDKPVGIATTAPDGGPSLFAIARQLDPHAPVLHPLSRLDTQVSGLVTFVRTPHANQVAIEARKLGTLRRAYLGLTARPPGAVSGDWRFPIAIDVRDPKHRRALSEQDERAQASGVKDAHTRYRVHASAGPLAALDLWPVTGRTHQLRVHASAAGCPLAGDPAYGGDKRITLANGRILSAGRAMLHCAAFRMPDPAADGGAVIELALAAPADMIALWKAAGGDPALLALSFSS